MQTIRQDWHRADIRAALEKKDTNLRTLSVAAGLSKDTLRNALVRPWPKGERIIALAIGVAPEEIWPSRYVKKMATTPVIHTPLLRQRETA